MPDWERRFVYAIAFCLAYEEEAARRDLEAWNQSGAAWDAAAEGTAGSYLGAAAWALSLPGGSEAGHAQSPIALVSGGATRIKGYVFESARLPEIRGASELLDRINLALPALWEQIGCADCVIYANGGEVLAFAPVGRSAELADDIERAYTGETMVAQSVAVTRTFTLQQVRDGLAAGQTVDDAAVRALLGYNPAANPTFGSLVAPLALARYRRREGNPDEGRELAYRAQAHFETVPFARRCESCDRRAAVVVRPVAMQENQFQSLCEPCARKRAAGKEAESFWCARFERWLKDERPGAIRAPRDLSEIAQASRPAGFVGVVYADGNNMGALLETRRTPVQYARFAEAVYEATRTAVFAALEASLREPDGGFRPFEILSIGGDDLFLIVPADAALPIACDLADWVERELLAEHADQFEARKEGRRIRYAWSAAQRCRPPEETLAPGGIVERQCEVSLSVGVVLAPEHTPVFHQQNFAEALLKSAKKRAKWLKRAPRGYYGGTVDFLSLKSVGMIGDGVEEFRKAALRAEGRRLTALPYTIAETRALMESVRLLRRSDFPKNQLYRLRGSLREGRWRSTVDYLYFLSRSGDLRARREAIEALWTPEGASPPHPWRTPLERGEADAPEWETIWHDLVELYDFVPAGNGDAAPGD